MAAVDVGATILQAVRRTIGSPQWLRDVDPDRRAWLMLHAVCEALHPLGAVIVPSRVQIEQVVARQMRDQAIWDGFDGRNYEALARKHHLTSRQVRRIVERMRRPA